MKYTQETYLQKVKEVHGNKYDYSETIFTKSSEKIKVICKTHG